MKAGWEIKKLGDVIQKTETVNPLNFPEDEFNYIDVSSVSNTTFQIEETQFLIGKDAPSRARRKVKENDVLFATIRPTLRRIAIVPQFLDEQVCSTAYFVLRPKKGIDHRYIFYWLFSEEFMGQMEVLQKGASYPAVTDAEVKAQLIPLPPLPEQRRIVAILDEAFAGIAAAKEKAEQNLKNAKEVFASYLKQMFNTKKGWINDNIGEICLLKSGTTMPHDLEKETGDIPYLKVADMNFEENNGYITMSSRFLDKKDIKDSMIIPKGAVIFPKRGGAILTNKKRMTSIPICADLNIMAVIPTGKIESKLLYYYFLDVDMKKIGTGSSIPQINNYDISPLSIAYPRDLSKQKEIVSFLDEISEETGTLESIYQQKLSNLEELKKSLLQQAFSGAL